MQNYKNCIFVHVFKDLPVNILQGQQPAMEEEEEKWYGLHILLVLETCL